MPTLRWLTKDDMDDVLEIERYQFIHPWDDKHFRDALRDRNTIGKAFEDDREQVIGYMVFKLGKRHLELLNIAVDGQHQRAGVGTSMINSLKNNLARDRRYRIAAKVWERNVGAQLFFQKMGFICTDTIRDHYEDSQDHVYVMEYLLGQEAPQEALECSNQ